MVAERSFSVLRTLRKLTCSFAVKLTFLRDCDQQICPDTGVIYALTSENMPKLTLVSETLLMIEL